MYEQAPRDDLFLREEAGRQRTASRLLHMMASFRQPPGRLLDVGCGPGLFLEEARRQGWDVRGVELARWACEEARNRLGAAVVEQGDTLQLLKLNLGTFDVVAALDVIEHVSDPRSFLIQLSAMLRPGGLLVLTLPRWDSLVARLWRKHWRLIFSAHLFYFTSRALQRLLSQVGFKTLRVKWYWRDFSLRYLIYRVRTMISSSPTASFSPPASAGKEWTMPISLGDEVVVWAQKKE